MKSLFSSRVSRRLVWFFSISISFCLIAYLAATERLSHQESQFLWPIDESESKKVSLANPKIPTSDRNPFDPFDEELYLAQEETPEEEILETENEPEDFFANQQNKDNYELLFPQESEDKNPEILKPDFLVYDDTYDSSDDENETLSFDRVQVQATLLKTTPEKIKTIHEKEKVPSAVGYKNAPQSSVTTDQRAGSFPPVRTQQVTTIGHSRNVEIVSLDDDFDEFDDIDLIDNLTLARLFEDEKDHAPLKIVNESALKSVVIQATVQPEEPPRNTIGPNQKDYSPGSARPRNSQVIATAPGTPQLKERSPFDGVNSKIEVISEKYEKPKPLGVGHPEYEPFFPPGSQNRTIEGTSFALGLGASIESFTENENYIVEDSPKPSRVIETKKDSWNFSKLFVFDSDKKEEKPTERSEKENSERKKEENSKDDNSEERLELPPVETYYADDAVESPNHQPVETYYANDTLENFNSSPVETYYGNDAVESPNHQPVETYYANDTLENFNPLQVETYYANDEVRNPNLLPVETYYANDAVENFNSSPVETYYANDGVGSPNHQQIETYYANDTQENFNSPSVETYYVNDALENPNLLPVETYYSNDAVENFNSPSVETYYANDAAENTNLPPIASYYANNGESANDLFDGVAAQSIAVVKTAPRYIGYSQESDEPEIYPGSKGPWPNQDLVLKDNVGRKSIQKPLLALASTLLTQNATQGQQKAPGEITPTTTINQSSPKVEKVDEDNEPEEEPIDLKTDSSIGPARTSTEETTPLNQQLRINQQFQNQPREPGSTEGVVSTPKQVTPPQPVEQPPLTPPPTAKEGFLINFANVSIVEYINFISKITGKNFIFDPGDLDFRVTIVSNEPTSINNIMAALLQELRIHDLALMEVGNNLIIHRNPKANSPATVVTDGAPSIRNQELITRVYHLTNTSAEQIVPVIRPMLSSFALVEAVEGSGHLIVTDLTSNIEKINALVKSLDAPAADLEIGQYHVSYASAEEVVALADKILAPIAQGKTLTFVPHTPTNSVFIISTPYLVERAISILHQVDVPQGQGTTRILSTVPPTSITPQLTAPTPSPVPSELESGRLIPEPSTLEGGPTSAGRWTSNLPLGHVESTRFFIRKLHYRRGDQIVDALRRVGESLQFSGGFSPEVAIQNTDLITTINSVQWLESSNSLIYTGTIDSIIRLTQLIDEIDIPVRQVLIEMLILETNVDDAIDFSVDWGSRFGGLDTAGAQGFFKQGSPLVAALDTTQIGSIPNASGLARSAGFSSGVIGRRVTHGGAAFQSLGFLVEALHADLRADVVMNPKVVVEDNTPAEVFVGLEARFQTQTIANDFGTILTSNFEYRDVGATLRVTPLIGSDDMITLDVEMEITTLITQSLVVGSNVVNETAAVLNQANLVQVVPVERKSRTISKIHLPNKYFVILSGMLQEELDRVRNNLPCLGGVPIIGALFSNKSTLNIRRNLMLFIRPQIIDPEDIDPVTKRQQDLFREKNRQRKAWEYEVDEALWFFNLKHICDPDEKEDILIP